MAPSKKSRSFTLRKEASEKKSVNFVPLTEQEKDSPICYSCAAQLGLQWSQEIPTERKWDDTCSFCETRCTVFKASEADNI